MHLYFSGLATTFGICVPKICNPEYFRALLEGLSSQMGLPLANYSQTMACSDGIDPEFSAVDIAAM
jgi:hypothetical protein